MDETAWLLARYPNVYVNLEWTVSLLFTAPRRFAEVLGNMMYWGGEDRILWAAGAMLVHPQVVLEAFLDFQMPDDLVQGYGYPKLTEESKRKMLGENYAACTGSTPRRPRPRWSTMSGPGGGRPAPRQSRGRPFGPRGRSRRTRNGDPGAAL